jgi:hypothetical protein
MQDFLLSLRLSTEKVQEICSLLEGEMVDNVEQLLLVSSGRSGESAKTRAIEEALNGSLDKQKPIVKASFISGILKMERQETTARVSLGSPASVAPISVPESATIPDVGGFGGGASVPPLAGGCSGLAAGCGPSGQRAAVQGRLSDFYGMYACSGLDTGHIWNLHNSTLQ